MYGVFAIGSFVYHLLEYSLASEDSRLYSAIEDDMFYRAVDAVFGYTDGPVFGLLFAFGIGVYYHTSTDAQISSYQPAAIAAAAGTAVVLVVSLLLMTVTAPDAIDFSIGDEIAGVLVSLIGATVTAVLTAVVLDRQVPA
ncbi:hypothetical protein DV733_02410 [Halapricum salinum]|uniref:Uncharacterized protein n=2 Tax=Halapricum salinum TaxID=1457250 RepID=A0A4D6H8Q6_9EURY|nr:hypothetical protein DV733_02410 [Halapricum salinum]